MTDSTLADVEVLGMDLIERWTRMQAHYRASRTCPGCDEDLRRVALQELVYTFRNCNCGDPSYAHLVEQLWHLVCLRPPAAATP